MKENNGSSYIVVMGYTLEELEAKVNDKIKENYIPIGGIGVCQTLTSGQLTYQAMFKVELPDINKLLEAIGTNVK